MARTQREHAGKCSEMLKKVEERGPELGEKLKKDFGPLDPDLLRRIWDLTKGVEVDLNEPLRDEDE